MECDTQVGVTNNQPFYKCNTDGYWCSEDYQGNTFNFQGCADQCSANNFAAFTFSLSNPQSGTGYCSCTTSSGATFISTSGNYNAYAIGTPLDPPAGPSCT